MSILKYAGLLFMLLFFAGFQQTVTAQSKSKKIRVLIIDGQNNHGNWPQTSKMMKGYLEETGLFEVDIQTTAPEGLPVDYFAPDFAAYKVVVMNYNGANWSPSTEQAFEKFISEGGGMVSVHAADNSFPQWLAYNKMIGLGGWNNRSEKDGPYLYYNDHDELIRDTSPGLGGSHGKFHAFVVKTRNTQHPITRGMPTTWMHARDELYDRLRGPAENVDILATAFSAKDQNGTGRHEPIMMALRYGKGRIFHTTLGHANESQQCVGFITYLQRGTEWAATGKVKQKPPVEFPGESEPMVRK